MNSTNTAHNEKFVGEVAHFFLALRAATVKNTLEIIRYPLNALFWVALPIIWTLPVYFLIVSFAPTGTSLGLKTFTGSDDFHSWFMIGMLAGYVISDMLWSLGFLMRHLMLLGVLETLWTCPIRPLTFLITEGLYRIFEIGYSLVVIALMGRYIYGFTLPDSFFTTWPLWVPFFAIVLGIAIGFSGIVILVKDAGSITDIGSFAIETLAGVRNPPQALPRAFLFIALAFPLTYAVDILRVHGMGLQPIVSHTTELTIFLLSAAMVPVAGSLLFRWAERRCRRLGLLGQF